MKSLLLPLAAAALSIAVPAQAAPQDQDRTGVVVPVYSNIVIDPIPMFPIYRASGVRDSGGAYGVGVATSLLCTNLSSTTEYVKIIVRNYTGAVLLNQTYSIPATATYTMSTHGTNVFDEDIILMAGTVVNQGNVTMTASTTNIYCSAMILDAAASVPQGVSLHLLRFNPMAGAEGE